MKRLSVSRLIAFAACVFGLADAVLGNGSDPDEVNRPASVTQKNSGAHLQCILPDGNIAGVALRERMTSGPTVLLMDDGTVSCPLRQGDTIFLVALPLGAAARDRFTFINENAAARGELKIAVSNDRLAAASTKWRPVEGNISFNRKRLFNLSLLGIEARYVRLTFHVEQEQSASASAENSKRASAARRNDPADDAALNFIHERPRLLGWALPFWSALAPLASCGPGEQSGIAVSPLLPLMNR